MKYFKFSLTIFIFWGIMIGNPARAQAKDDIADLPVTLIPAKNQPGETMVLFLTGDGGLNTFSQKLVDQYAATGIPVVALNSSKYFWKRRTPDQSAQDISTLLYKYTKDLKKKSILLCGYSFGADVLPFIYMRLPQDLKEKVSRIQLLSPSAYTDFEVHLSYLFVSKKFDIASEVKKIAKPVLCYYGASESDKPLNGLAMKNFKLIILKGDHHYNNSFSEIVDTGL